MTTRLSAPVGAPCWTDLWTSDTEASRRFYGELFGWESAAPNPEFGGYFMFMREGQPIAGAMGDMGEMKANNTWKIYLSTDDISRSVIDASSAGASIAFSPEPVADLGVQSVFSDPQGATLGMWQPGTFPGFGVLGEHGAPSWFELYTSNFDAANEFYSSVFRLATEPMSDTPEFRYSVLRPEGHDEVCGIMDATAMHNGAVPYWITYWDVTDVDAAVAHVLTLGGDVIEQPADSPYGRIASVTDVTGAALKLRSNTR